MENHSEIAKNEGFKWEYPRTKWRCLMGKSSANKSFCWKIIELNAGIVIAMFDCESVSRVDIRYCQVLMFSGFECCWAS